MNDPHLHPRSLVAAFLLGLLLSPAASHAVVGGAPVSVGTAPWLVALADTERVANQACLDSGGSELFCTHYCGGVLISPSWVLTAAHCVDDSLSGVSNLRLVMGGADLNDPVAPVALVSHKVVHVNHDPAPSFDNDLALLKLATPESRKTASISSPAEFAALESAAPGMNDEAQLFGYGRLSSTGSFASLPRQVAFDIQSDAACAAAYNDVSIVNYFPDVMLCAYEPDAAAVEPNDAGGDDPADPDGEDACTLDSGGPLFDVSASSPRLVGLVSFGDKSNCGDPARPSVYTQVEEYLSWLESVTASAGAPIGDAAVDVTVAQTAQPGVDQTVTVVLSNGSINTVYPVPAFELSVAGGASLTMSDPGFLSCSEAGGTHSCSAPADMNPGNALTATFSLSPATLSDEVAVVTAAISSIGPEDYRLDNNEVVRRVVFSNKPDLVLESRGVVTAVQADGGSVHLFLTVRNQSTETAASAVQVALAPAADEDYEIVTASGGTCGGSPAVICSVGELAAESMALLEVELFSASRQDGQLNISATSSSTDYPTQTVDGAADTELVAQVTFREVSSSPGAGGGSSGGGGMPSPVLLAVVLLLLQLRVRPPTT